MTTNEALTALKSDIAARGRAYRIGASIQIEDGFEFEVVQPNGQRRFAYVTSFGGQTLVEGLI